MLHKTKNRVTARPRPATPFFLLVLGMVAVVIQARDLPVQPAPVEHARNLEITPCDHSTTVTVRNAWPDAPDLTYVLVPRRSTQPMPVIQASDGTVIRTPVRRVVSLSTPNIPFLRDLGVLDTLVAVDTGDYVYDADVLERIAAGDVRSVGTGASLDLERVIELAPDVVLVSALGPDDPAVTRLRGAGVPVLVVADWRESTPLGRAEWLRLFGALFERDARAAEIFRERADRYTEIRDRVTRRVPSDQRPTVFANGPWQGQWPVPAGDSYMARLFADAGAQYLWAHTEGTGSIFLDLEAVLARALTADYWINLNYDWTNMADVRRADRRLTTFAAYRAGRLYHYIRRVRPSGANDFWETGVGRPDLVLADLVAILHADDPAILPDHEPVFYQRIGP